MSFLFDEIILKLITWLAKATVAVGLIDTNSVDAR